jgi:hypothetical protein
LYADFQTNIDIYVNYIDINICVSIQINTHIFVTQRLDRALRYIKGLFSVLQLFIFFVKMNKVELH